MIGDASNDLPARSVANLNDHHHDDHHRNDDNDFPFPLYIRELSIFSERQKYTGNSQAERRVQ